MTSRYRKPITDEDHKASAVDGKSTEFDSKVWLSQGGWGVIQDDRHGYFEVLDALPGAVRKKRDAMREGQDSETLVTMWGSRSEPRADLLPAEFVHTETYGDINEEQHFLVGTGSHWGTSPQTLSVSNFRDAFATADSTPNVTVTGTANPDPNIVLNSIIAQWNTQAESAADDSIFNLAHINDSFLYGDDLSQIQFVLHWNNAGPVTSDGEDKDASNSYENATLSYTQGTHVYHGTLSAASTVRGTSVHEIIEDSDIANRRFYDVNMPDIVQDEEITE